MDGAPQDIPGSRWRHQPEHLVDVHLTGATILLQSLGFGVFFPAAFLRFDWEVHRCLTEVCIEIGANSVSYVRCKNSEVPRGLTYVFCELPRVDCTAHGPRHVGDSHETRHETHGRVKHGFDIPRVSGLKPSNGEAPSPRKTIRRQPVLKFATARHSQRVQSPTALEPSRSWQNRELTRCLH